MEQLKNEIHDEAEDTEREKKEIERKAAKRAITRAKVDSWDLNIAILLFIVLILVTILLYQGIAIEIVASIATLGLSFVWLVGWRRRRELYGRYYGEELVNLAWESSIKTNNKETACKNIEETVEKYVERVLLEGEGKLRTTN